MSKYSDKAIALRNDPNTHYNCAQAVFMSFANEAGISDEQAFNISANFGSGMKMASVCGAITGGLMALGKYAYCRLRMTQFGLPLNFMLHCQC